MPKNSVGKSVGSFSVGNFSLGRFLVVTIGIVSLLAFSLSLSRAGAQDTIREAQQRQEAIEEERQRATDGIAYLSAQEYAIVKGREEAVAALEEQQAKINTLNQAKEATAFQLTQLDEKMAELRQQLAEINDMARALAIQRYMQDSIDPVEILFSNMDVSDGLALLALTETLFGDTADAIEQARIVEDELRLASERATALQAEIQRLQAELEASLPELESRRAEWADLEEQYNDLREQWQNSLASLEAEDRRLTEFIQQRRAEEEIRRKLAALAQTGGNGFVRPALGAVVSNYGNRLHPILGYYRLHAGIDFDGSTGDPIIASRNGVVILAEYYGGYGNTVILDHGDGFTSLYAHLSSYNVSEGDTIEAGRTLGAMGSTGLSTGPHLHFEIRQNGAPVDPLPYLQ